MEHSSVFYNLKENVLNDKIAYSVLTIGIIFLSLTLFGILGNFSLFYHYLLHYHTECRLTSTDSIFKHQSVGNSMVILCKGVPQTMGALGLKRFFNDFLKKDFIALASVAQRLSASLLIKELPVRFPVYGTCLGYRPGHQ